MNSIPFDGSKHPRGFAGKFSPSSHGVRPLGHAESKRHAVASPGKLREGARDNSKLFGDRKAEGPGYGGAAETPRTTGRRMIGD